MDYDNVNKVIAMSKELEFINLINTKLDYLKPYIIVKYEDLLPPNEARNSRNGNRYFLETMDTLIRMLNKASFEKGFLRDITANRYSLIFEMVEDICLNLKEFHYNRTIFIHDDDNDVEIRKSDDV